MARYYTLNERIKIETLLENKVAPKEIAEQLGRHYTSVYREIKRGTVVQLDTHLRPYEKYCADVGQRKMEDAGHNKGTELKIKNDISTLKTAEKLIKEQRYSPYAVSVYLGATDKHTHLSKGTIYNYIHGGVFLNLTENDLIYKTHKKKDKQDKRPKYNKTGMKSIEDRPKEINKRDTYGHWEMDTVYSGKDKSKTCLLVLSERMTREERIIKIMDRTAQSVLDAINALEKEIGYTAFKRTFKTITCDNGVEFSKHKELELSSTCVGIRTQVYFCHPYCSCERGTNENSNKLIRKYVPKGCDIGEYSDGRIQEIEDTINNYPRELFGGLSANEYKQLCNIA